MSAVSRTVLFSVANTCLTASGSPSVSSMSPWILTRLRSGSGPPVAAKAHVAIALDEVCDALVCRHRGGAGILVLEEQQAVHRHFVVDESEAEGAARVIEQSPPGTGHGRGDDESEGIDEARRQQGIAESGTAVDLEFPPWLCFERSDGPDRIAAEHGRRAPTPLR